MNHTSKEAQSFFKGLKKPWLTKKKIPKNLELIIFPSFLSLESSKKFSKTLPVSIGAQNVHFKDAGPYTGEISGTMLKNIGVDTVLIGHSERRQYFNETNETVHSKAKALLSQGFKIMLCIGETLNQRQSGETKQVIEEQLRIGLPKVIEVNKPFLNGKLSIAYEPVWAIGTGLTATVEQIEDAHQMIRTFLNNEYGEKGSGTISILYGGSVNPENIASILTCPSVDGALVGGASLKKDSYLKLIRASIIRLKS